MSLILIVEDNEKNMKLVRDVLRVKGYDTLEAVTAEDGIKLASERKPDLILMDIHLPGMNGIEALHVLRGNSDTAPIPVIAVTAFAIVLAAINGVFYGGLRLRNNTTKEDGSYHFSGLKVDTNYELKADYNDATTSWKRLSVFDERKVAIINLKLDQKKEKEK